MCHSLMVIKEVHLNNFRIYYGSNTIRFIQDDNRNIFIISGKNGFGKTTFLMSLVWCLYGRQMEDVDDLYRKEISDQGGYARYISNSLNRLAKYEGESVFSVSITFTDVNIQELPCKELKIIRSFNVNTGTKDDEVQILIDGRENELAHEIGPDTFIRDFILPKEIAKFFLFDAEKIVSLAEYSSVEQRKKLSQAYSEVLGIKKYEYLKRDLEQVQVRLRQDSASPKERQELNRLKAEVQNCIDKIDAGEERGRELKQLLQEHRREVNEIQNRLIREGSVVTEDELKVLREEEEGLKSKLDILSEELRSYFDIIPFAIAGRKIAEIATQLELESEARQAQYRRDSLKDAEERFLAEFRDIYGRRGNLIIHQVVDEFYQREVRHLVIKHFLSAPEQKEALETVKALHEFSDSENNELNALLDNLKKSFRESFKRLTGDVTKAKNDFNTIQRRLREAESKKEDPVIAILRDEKNKIEDKIMKLDQEIEDINRELGAAGNEKTQHEKRILEISKKLSVSEANKQKDEIITRQIHVIKEFISEFKEKKKASLENQILKGLNILMHKTKFVHKVEVSLIGEDIDISLINKRGEEIKKESLSKGEQQMYATALLKALVEESDIDFPVFIDSPLQKFDEDHARNMIQHFYPSVAEQVVIFPLINKEMNEEEFSLMLSNIAQTWLIENHSDDQSGFTEIEPPQFLKKYFELYGTSY